MAEAGEQTDVGAAEPRPSSPRRWTHDLETGLDAEEPEPNATSTTRASRNAWRRSDARRSSPSALCALFGTFIAAAIVFVTPADTSLVAKQVLVWLTLTLLALTVVYGVVHGIAWTRRRGVAPDAGARAADRSRDPQLAAREERVPRHQPAAGRRELDLPVAHGGTRAREIRPHQRAAAVESPRARGCSITRSGASCSRCCCPNCAARASCPTALAFWLGHPLVAPVLITGTWIADRGAADRVARHHAGQVALRRATSSSRSPTPTRVAIRARTSSARRKRSFRVWWEGVGCGFPLLAPILIAVAYEKVAQNQETDWDFAQDCLVTHGPPGVLNTVTGVCGLAAMLWLYGVAWHQPMAIRSRGRARRSPRRCLAQRAVAVSRRR